MKNQSLNQMFCERKGSFGLDNKNYPLQRVATTVSITVSPLSYFISRNVPFYNSTEIFYVSFYLTKANTTMTCLVWSSVSILHLAREAANGTQPSIPAGRDVLLHQLQYIGIYLPMSM